MLQVEVAAISGVKALLNEGGAQRPAGRPPARGGKKKKKKRGVMAIVLGKKKRIRVLIRFRVRIN